MTQANANMEVAMGLISFEQSLDIIEQAKDEVADELHKEEPLVYLNTMVMPADRRMIKAMKKRTGLSEGHIVREIFNQWREFMLRGCDEQR